MTSFRRDQARLRTESRALSSRPPVWHAGLGLSLGTLRAMLPGGALGRAGVTEQDGVAARTPHGQVGAMRGFALAAGPGTAAGRSPAPCRPSPG